MDAIAQVLQIHKLICGLRDAGGNRHLAQKLLIFSFLQHQASDVRQGCHTCERNVCLTFTCSKTILGLQGLALEGLSIQS